MTSAKRQCNGPRVCYLQVVGTSTAAGVRSCGLWPDIDDTDEMRDEDRDEMCEMRWDGTRRDEARRGETGSDEMGWDGMGWDGEARMY